MKNKLKSKKGQIQKICDYLLKQCEEDKVLAERVMLERKTPEKMYRYIVQTAKIKFKDEIVDGGLYVEPDEVYSLAVHYFLEDDSTLEAEGVQIAKSFVNHQTAAKPYTGPRNSKSGQPVRKESPVQFSLFDIGLEG